MTVLENILKEHGPMMSNNLAQILSFQQNLKLNSASQRVTRSKEILQLKGFFKSNQSLCYLSEHARDENFTKTVNITMFENGKKYWYTLNALKMHDGVISQKYLECYTNYPVLPLKKHIPFKEVMQKFVSQGILVFNNNDYIFSPRFNSRITNPLLHRTIELLKDGIIEDFHSMARNIGLISYNSGELFAEFGKFRWAFKGVSPIIGLKDDRKFGYLLADVLIGKPFYKNDILFFTEKLDHIASFKNNSRIIPFLLIDDIETEGLLHLKQKGIVVGFIKEIFGHKYASTLKELLTVLNNAGASLKSDPEKYLELIKELKKYNEGLANNIKGTLFEFVVGHIHSRDCQNIDLGREVIANGMRRDMDVFATYSDKVVISECKALKQSIDEETINDWLTTTIPVFNKWILSQETLKEKNKEFQFWSTSGFTSDAEELLNKAIDSVSKYKISYYGPKDLREKAIKMKNKKLKEALDNYFILPKV